MKSWTSDPCVNDDTPRYTVLPSSHHTIQITGCTCHFLSTDYFLWRAQKDFFPCLSLAQIERNVFIARQLLTWPKLPIKDHHKVYKKGGSEIIKMLTTAKYERDQSTSCIFMNRSIPKEKSLQGSVSTMYFPHAQEMGSYFPFSEHVEQFHLGARPSYLSS